VEIDETENICITYLLYFFISIISLEVRGPIWHNTKNDTQYFTTLVHTITKQRLQKMFSMYAQIADGSASETLPHTSPISTAVTAPITASIAEATATTDIRSPPVLRSKSTKRSTNELPPTTNSAIQTSQNPSIPECTCESYFAPTCATHQKELLATKMFSLILSNPHMHNLLKCLPSDSEGITLGQIIEADKTQNLISLLLEYKHINSYSMTYLSDVFIKLLYRQMVRHPDELCYFLLLEKLKKWWNIHGHNDTMLWPVYEKPVYEKPNYSVLEKFPSIVEKSCASIAVIAVGVCSVATFLKK
jgi:hypothetical protein